MYQNLLILHSIIRWIAILVLFAGILFLFINKSQKNIFTNKHYFYFNIIKHLLNLQFVIGAILLTQSPMVHAFWSQISQAVKWREIRFFGLEHPFMMILSILVLNFITYKSKKLTYTTKGFNYLFWGYLVVFILIFISIPWSFSPFTTRPLFRFF